MERRTAPRNSMVCFQLSVVCFNRRLLFPGDREVRDPELDGAPDDQRGAVETCSMLDAAR